MVSYKLDKYDKYFVAFILVILVIFNIGSCFATEESTQETVQAEVVNGLFFSDQRNYMYSASNKVYCFPIEKGYIYTFTNNNDTWECPICFTYDSAGVNVPIYNVMTIQPRETYSFISNDYNYLFFNSIDRGVLTREKIANMDGAVGDLVSNVGINQLWSVFEGGIDFIGVVVLVAFGLFLIVLLIKKLSKGKSDF